MAMSRRWLLALLAGTVLLVGTVNASAQVTGNGPYYSVPSWDQTFPSAQRFMILSNFGSLAVLDRETGLVWERSPDTAVLDWYSAILACTTRTTGGRKAWRLPSIHELASLVDPTVASPGPTLPPGHPFLNISPYDFFWSGTSTGDPALLAWGLWFGTGEVDEYVKNSSPNPQITLRIWCVRGPSAEHQY